MQIYFQGDETNNKRKYPYVCYCTVLLVSGSMFPIPISAWFQLSDVIAAP